MNRLKHLMLKLISEFQSSFVPGRHFTDNITVAQEVKHSLRKMKGRRGIIAIKVDLEKAYDRLRWDFIGETLTEARLPNDVVELIMKCIESASLSVMWNGRPAPKFRPRRGVRQGDPLSPYIFVLCLEKLSQIINREVDNGSWRPFRVNRRMSGFKTTDDLGKYLGIPLLHQRATK